MTDPSAPRDATWVLRARSLLDHSARDLDAATLSRLNRARQAALASMDPSTRESAPWMRWIGAAAICAGIALIAWHGVRTPPASPSIADAPAAESPLPSPSRVAAPPLAPAGGEASLPVSEPDFELLADADGFGLLEDLEFYAWLDADGKAGG